MVKLWSYVGTTLTFFGVPLYFLMINLKKQNASRWLSSDFVIQNRKEFAGRFTKSGINIEIISHSTRAQKGLPIMRKRSVHLNPYIGFFIVLRDCKNIYVFKKYLRRHMKNYGKIIRVCIRLIFLHSRP